MHDSTRSFSDSIGNSAITRKTFAALPGMVPNYAYNAGRTSFTARNTRFGVRLASPEFEGWRPSAVLEVDFMANPGAFNANTLAGGNISEASFFSNGVFRTRHAYVKLESDYIDILGGQTYFIFGNQSFFQPCAVDFLPIPNQIFGRSPQFRFSHGFKSDPINVDVAVGAMRPPQRDSSVPDGQGSLKIALNHWKGMHTPGSGGTSADAMAIAVSGTVRRIKVDSFMAVPDSGAAVTGSAVAVDALVPVIPVPDANHRGNALTLNGEFSKGTGYADQIGGLTGGASFPAYPAPPMGGTQAVPDIDQGMVTYDRNGVLHTINWQTFIVGIQYYLPPYGRAFVSANYSQANSNNIIDLIEQGNATPAAAGTISTRGKNAFKRSRYFDANLLYDIAPQVRVGVTYHLQDQTYGDGEMPKTTRFMLALLYYY